MKHKGVRDTAYGDGKQNDFFRTNFECRRLLLHAHAIEFMHPSLGERIKIRAPLDSALCAVLEALSWGAVALP